MTSTQDIELTVTFTDQHGCQDYDKLTVEYHPLVFIPNTFTPDGNIFNNDFFAVSANVTFFKIEIFNRWGELVYEGAGTDAAWDGKHMGKECPDGTYTWRITYTDTANESYVETGHVNLLY